MARVDRREQVMTDEERIKARAVVQAFDRAANVMPWEHSPLSPRTGGPGSLRDALLAMVKGAGGEELA